ncbi:MAG: hypothetical protein BWY83_02517 [bacterium ADurb.Bin478]|nr:MAG: hypothetical protein BWY83_02517 [bacterium ADurb.Bin478]
MPCDPLQLWVQIPAPVAEHPLEQYGPHHQSDSGLLRFVEQRRLPLIHQVERNLYHIPHTFVYGQVGLRHRIGRNPGGANDAFIAELRERLTDGF